MSIRDLPDKWRNNPDSHESAEYQHKDAAELQAALPVWTKITEHPATYPDIDGEEVLFWGARWQCLEIAEPKYAEIGDWWRPLCDLDYPPEADND